MTDPETQTLLFVENEILARLAISDYLRECGYKVIEATSADEARTVHTSLSKVRDGAIGLRFRAGRGPASIPNRTGCWTDRP